jgi:hypothetical protein
VQPYETLHDLDRCGKFFRFGYLLLYLVAHFAVSAWFPGDCDSFFGHDAGVAPSLFTAGVFHAPHLVKSTVQFDIQTFSESFLMLVDAVFW